MGTAACPGAAPSRALLLDDGAAESTAFDELAGTRLGLDRSTIGQQGADDADDERHVADRVDAPVASCAQRSITPLSCGTCGSATRSAVQSGQTYSTNGVERLERRVAPCLRSLC